MASFVIMEPPAKPGVNAAEGTLFVRDGFSFLALVVPVFWLLFYRLWFQAGLVLAVSVALGIAGRHWNMPGTATVLTFLVSLLVALEGANWRLAALRRRGYADKGAIDADDRQEAETRYFADGDFTGEASPLPAPRKKRAARPAQPKPDTRLGLVGFPGEH